MISIRAITQQGQELVLTTVGKCTPVAEYAHGWDIYSFETQENAEKYHGGYDVFHRNSDLIKNVLKNVFADPSNEYLAVFSHIEEE